MKDLTGADVLPAAGFHDVPMEKYQSWKAINAGTLKWADKSMEHVKACLDGELDRDPTAALRFGRAIHAALLEPSVFRSQFVVASSCNATLKSGARKGSRCGKVSKFRSPSTNQWFCGTHVDSGPTDCIEPDDFVSESDQEHIRAIRDKVMTHNVVKLLRQHGGFETSILWEYNGVPCKSRLDKFISGESMPLSIVDLKKVQLGGGDDESFSRSVSTYGYDIAAAYYCDAVEFVLGKKPAFIWVVIEDKPPYAVNVIQADRETLDIGRYRYQSYFAELIRSRESGVWAGYTRDIHTGGLPTWDRKKYAGLIS